MLWYPVKAVRGLQVQVPVPRGPDRRRLLQRRRLRALPEPGADAARARVLEGRRGRDLSPPGWPSTAATRSSSTTARPARRARPARSTRSTTTPSTRRASTRPSAATWEDYEIEVVGQHYTIRRNGEVINEFDNTPGKNSDRAGDPEHDAAAVHRGLHRPPEPRRRGHDAVPQHARRGPDAGRAEGRGRHRPVRRSPGAVRTRSRSARSTPPATRRSETFDFEIGRRCAPPTVGDATTPPIDACRCAPTSRRRCRR